MIYRDFQDTKLSALGFGCMRLPIVDGNDADIDVEAARAMVAYAMEHGINYYDTAWGYHGGNSELVMGQILADYPRGSFYLATKFPGYDLSKFGHVAETFERQLEKCRVDHFDFYLAHNVCEMNIDAYMDDARYGTIAYLREQKEAGRISHLGFSCHGSYDVLKRYLDEYGRYMEFCQLQINYLDWSFQDAKTKVELLEGMGIPVIVMEPLRGGKLASLEDAYAGKLAGLRPDASPVEWAFRFTQGIPSVAVTLSGMSNMDQLVDNVRIFSDEAPLSQDELAALQEIADDMTGKVGVPCTACRYCTTYCPRGLDIPKLLALYNEHTFTGGGFIAPMAIGTMPAEKRPSACIGCRRCERVCPQGIKISEAMRDFAAKLG